MKLGTILKEILLEVSIEQLKQQFVDSKKVSDKVFKDVIDAVGSKSAYATWLLKKVVDKQIKDEDIYKWKGYINIFERHKSEYKYNDIFKFKTKEDLTDFVTKSVEIQNKEKHDPSSAKGIAKADKYKEFKLGEVDGFDVYEIPKGRNDLYGMSCELGSGTEWCTATGKTSHHFQNYISLGPLYIFIKPGSDEKYQFSLVTEQYMDKDDQKIDVEEHKNLFEFLVSKGVELGIEIKLKLLIPLGKKDSVFNGELYISSEAANILPDGFRVEQSLYILEEHNGTTNKCKLPKNLYIGEDLSVSENDVYEIGEGLFVKGDFSIYVLKIKEFPKNTVIGGGYISLPYSEIEKLPDNLKLIKGDLDLRGSKIKELPQGLVVRGYANLSFSDIEKLPDDFNVDGDLIFQSTKVSELPKGMRVAGNINLHNTPLAKKYTKKEIIKMFPDIGGNIYGLEK